MESPNKFGGLLRSLHRGEQGTAMTEFIIVLPVFILIFIGVNELYKVNRNALRTKVTAAHATWQASMDVAHAGRLGALTHNLPLIASGQDLTRMTGSGAAKLAGQAKSLNMATGASRGEANRAESFLGFVGATSTSSSYPTASGTFPRYITDDSSTNSVSTWGPLGVYAPSALLSNLGPNQPHAAGIRYGIVRGEFSKTFSSPAGDYTAGDAYSMLVPPRPIRGLVGEHITIGFSRLSARKDSCLKNVLKIDYSMSYLSNCL